MPAGDIADNPYFKRDVRRNYPRLSTVRQTDVVRLLLEGSQADPSPSLSLGSDASGEGGGDSGGGGEKGEGDKEGVAKGEVVEVKAEGEREGLSSLLLSGKRTQNSSLNGIFSGPNGLPPFPTGMNSSSSSSSSKGEKRYVLDTERAEGYPEE